MRVVDRGLGPRMTMIIFIVLALPIAAFPSGEDDTIHELGAAVDEQQELQVSLLDEDSGRGDWGLGQSTDGDFGFFLSGEPKLSVTAQRATSTNGFEPGEPVSSSTLRVGAWLIGESSQQHFCLWHHKHAELCVTESEGIWRGDFLSKLDQSTVQLQPGRPVVSNAAGATWRYGQSAEGYFTVWLNDEAQMILTRDGRVWSAQQQGYLAWPAPTRTITLAVPVVLHQSSSPPGSQRLPEPNSTSITAAEHNAVAGWHFGASADGYFGVYLADSAKLWVHTDGASWGAKEGGYFAVSEPTAASIGRPQAGSTLASGQWTAGESADGHFGLWRGGECLWMINKTDGRAWAEGPGNPGYLSRDTESPVAPCGSAVLWTKMGGWSVGVDTTGSFVIWQSDAPRLVVAADGAVWASGGYLKASERNPRSPGMLSRPISLDRAATEPGVGGYNDESSGESQQMWASSELNGRVLYFESRNNCAAAQQAEGRCSGQWLSFSGHSLKAYPGQSLGDIARPSEVAVPWKLHSVEGASDQFYIESLWKCNSQDSRCGAWLTVNASMQSNAMQLSDSLIDPKRAAAAVWTLHPSSNRADEVLFEASGQCTGTAGGCARWLALAASGSVSQQHELVLVANEEQALRWRMHPLGGWVAPQSCDDDGGALELKTASCNNILKGYSGSFVFRSVHGWVSFDLGAVTEVTKLALYTPPGAEPVVTLKQFQLESGQRMSGPWEVEKKFSRDASVTSATFVEYSGFLLKSRYLRISVISNNGGESSILWQVRFYSPESEVCRANGMKVLGFKKTTSQSTDVTCLWDEMSPDALRVRSKCRRTAQHFGVETSMREWSERCGPQLVASPFLAPVQLGESEEPAECFSVVRQYALPSSVDTNNCVHPPLMSKFDEWTESSDGVQTATDDAEPQFTLLDSGELQTRGVGGMQNEIDVKLGTTYVFQVEGLALGEARLWIQDAESGQDVVWDPSERYQFSASKQTIQVEFVASCAKVNVGVRVSSGSTILELFSVKFSEACVNPTGAATECFDVDSAYEAGTSLPAAGPVLNAAACQALCAANQECSVFTFTAASQTCSLRHGDIIQVDSEGSTSGPASCAGHSSRRLLQEPATDEVAEEEAPTLGKFFPTDAETEAPPDFDDAAKGTAAYTEAARDPQPATAASRNPEEVSCNVEPLFEQMDGFWPLDQETFDISKNKLKLQLQGDWTNGEGMWPGTQSMCLSGQDSWFGLGHGHLRDSSTVSVWIQPAQDWQDTNLCILDTSGGSMLLLTASGSIRLQASPEDIAESTATGLITAGQWSNVVLVHDQTSKRASVYIDGQLIEMSNVQGDPGSMHWDTTAGELRVGAAPAVNGVASGFVGCVGNVGVWSRVLPEHQVEMLFSRECSPGKTLYLKPASLDMCELKCREIHWCNSFDFQGPLGQQEPNCRLLGNQGMSEHKSNEAVQLYAQGSCETVAPGVKQDLEVKFSDQELTTWHGDWTLGTGFARTSNAGDNTAWVEFKAALETDSKCSVKIEVPLDPEGSTSGNVAIYDMSGSATHHQISFRGDSARRPDVLTLASGVLFPRGIYRRARLSLGHADTKGYIMASKLMLVCVQLQPGEIPLQYGSKISLFSPFLDRVLRNEPVLVNAPKQQQEGVHWRLVDPVERAATGFLKYGDTIALESTGPLGFFSFGMEGSAAGELTVGPTHSGQYQVLDPHDPHAIREVRVGDQLQLRGGAKNEYLSVPADKSLDGALDSTVTIAVDAAGPQPTQWQLMVDSRPLIVQSSMLEASASAREGAWVLNTDGSHPYYHTEAAGDTGARATFASQLLQDSFCEVWLWIQKLPHGTLEGLATINALDGQVTKMRSWEGIQADWQYLGRHKLAGGTTDRVTVQLDKQSEGFISVSKLKLICQPLPLPALKETSVATDSLRSARQGIWALMPQPAGSLPAYIQGNRDETAWFELLSDLQLDSECRIWFWAVRGATLGRQVPVSIFTITGEQRTVVSLRGKPEASEWVQLGMFNLKAGSLPRVRVSGAPDGHAAVSSIKLACSPLPARSEVMVDVDDANLVARGGKWALDPQRGSLPFFINQDQEDQKVWFLFKATLPYNAFCDLKYWVEPRPDGDPAAQCTVYTLAGEEQKTVNFAGAGGTGKYLSLGKFYMSKGNSRRIKIQRGGNEEPGTITAARITMGCERLAAGTSLPLRYGDRVYLYSESSQKYMDETVSVASEVAAPNAIWTVRSASDWTDTKFIYYRSPMVLQQAGGSLALEPASQAELQPDKALGTQWQMQDPSDSSRQGAVGEDANVLVQRSSDRQFLNDHHGALTCTQEASANTDWQVQVAERAAVHVLWYDDAAAVKSKGNWSVGHGIGSEPGLLTDSLTAYIDFEVELPVKSDCEVLYWIVKSAVETAASTVEVSGVDGAANVDLKTFSNDEAHYESIGTFRMAAGLSTRLRARLSVGDTVTGEGAMGATKVKFICWDAPTSLPGFNASAPVSSTPAVTVVDSPSPQVEAAEAQVVASEAAAEVTAAQDVKNEAKAELVVAQEAVVQAEESGDSTAVAEAKRNQTELETEVATAEQIVAQAQRNETQAVAATEPTPAQEAQSELVAVEQAVQDAEAGLATAQTSGDQLAISAAQSLVNHTATKKNESVVVAAKATAQEWEDNTAEAEATEQQASEALSLAKAQGDTEIVAQAERDLAQASAQRTNTQAQAAATAQLTADLDAVADTQAADQALIAATVSGDPEAVAAAETMLTNAQSAQWLQQNISLKANQRAHEATERALLVQRGLVEDSSLALEHAQAAVLQAERSMDKQVEARAQVKLVAAEASYEAAKAELVLQESQAEYSKMAEQEAQTTQQPKRIQSMNSTSNVQVQPKRIQSMNSTSNVQVQKLKAAVIASIELSVKANEALATAVNPPDAEVTVIQLSHTEQEAQTELLAAKLTGNDTLIVDSLQQLNLAKTAELAFEQSHKVPPAASMALSACRCKGGPEPGASCTVDQSGEEPWCLVGRAAQCPDELDSTFGPWSHAACAGQPAEFSPYDNRSRLAHTFSEMNASQHQKNLIDAQSTTGQLVQDGLILNLDAHESASYPGKGNVWYDMSPFQNHLTTAGSHKPRFENTVEKGPRFVFDGAQYFDSTWGSPLSGSQYSVTMCARVEEHTPGPYATIISQHSADGGRCMGFISNDAHFSTEQWSPAGRRESREHQLDTALYVCEVVQKWDLHQSTGTKLYVNGELRSTAQWGSAVVNDVPPSPFRVGMWAIDRPDTGWRGAISAVQMYDRALSPEEVATNYAASLNTHPREDPVKVERAAMVPEGLVLHLDAATSYPGHGLEWTDLSPANNTMSTTSATRPTYVAGESPHFHFSGGQSFVSARDSPLAGDSVKFTVCAVLRDTAASDSATFLSQRSNSAAGQCLDLRARSGKLGTADCGRGSGRQLESMMPSRAVYHVCFAVDQWSQHHESTEIYLNGASQPTAIWGQSSATASLRAAPFVVGHLGVGGDDGWRGDIFSLQVYDRRLSDSEIYQNFRAALPAEHQDDFAAAAHGGGESDEHSTASFKKLPGELEYHWGPEGFKHEAALEECEAACKADPNCEGYSHSGGNDCRLGLITRSECNAHSLGHEWNADNPLSTPEMCPYGAAPDNKRSMLFVKYHPSSSGKLRAKSQVMFLPQDGNIMYHWGTGHWVKQGVSIRQCEAACLTDAVCTGFSYVDATQECRLGRLTVAGCNSETLGSEWDPISNPLANPNHCPSGPSVPGVVATLYLKQSGTGLALANLALNKVAAQSSVDFGAEAARGVDGNVNAQFSGESCFSTAVQEDPWWRVDLLSVATVMQVQVVARGDCCPEQGAEVQIHVGDDSANGGIGNQQCAATVNLPQGGVGTVVCDPPLHGRYVTLVRRGSSKQLAACEVKVMGIPGPSSSRVSQLSLARPTEQSSTEGELAASLAVDGKETSCAVTRKQSEPWLRVDLQSMAEVSTIELLTGGDSAATGGITIWVGSTTEEHGTQCGITDVVDVGNSAVMVCKPPLTGRYVTIGMEGDDQALGLCDVQIYGQESPTTAISNIGLSHLSNAIGGDAKLGNDGDLNTCFLSPKAVAAWWLVDLGAASLVRDVEILPGAGNTVGLAVAVHVGPFGSGGGARNSICGSPAPLLTGQLTHSVCSPARQARYVSVNIVSLVTKAKLSLCEVRVNGAVIRASTQKSTLALGRPATQSSTFGRADASRGVDGDSQNIMSMDSCFATEVQTSPWWQVMLPALSRVTSVEVVARGDAPNGATAIQVGVGMTTQRADIQKCGAEFSVAQGSTHTVGCPGRVGKYVTIIMPGGSKQLSLCEVRVVGKPLHEDPEASAAHDSYLLAESTTKLAQQAKEQAEEAAAQQAASKVQAKAALEGSHQTLQEAKERANSTALTAHEALDSQSEAQSAADSAAATLKDKIAVVTNVAIPARETAEQKFETAARIEANKKSTYDLAESQLSQTEAGAASTEQQFENAESAEAASKARTQQTTAAESQVEQQLKEAEALVSDANHQVATATQAKTAATQEDSSTQSAIETATANFEAVKAAGASNIAAVKLDLEAVAAAKGFAANSQGAEVTASKAAQEQVSQLNEASKSADAQLGGKRMELRQVHEQEKAAQATVTDAAHGAVVKLESELQQLQAQSATVSDQLEDTKAQTEETTTEQLNPQSNQLKLKKIDLTETNKLAVDSHLARVAAQVAMNESKHELSVSERAGNARIADAQTKATSEEDRATLLETRAANAAKASDEAGQEAQTFSETKMPAAAQNIKTAEAEAVEAAKLKNAAAVQQLTAQGTLKKTQQLKAAVDIKMKAASGLMEEQEAKLAAAQQEEAKEQKIVDSLTDTANEQQRESDEVTAAWKTAIDTVRQSAADIATAHEAISNARTNRSSTTAKMVLDEGRLAMAQSDLQLRKKMLVSIKESIKGPKNKLMNEETKLSARKKNQRAATRTEQEAEQELQHANGKVSAADESVEEAQENVQNVEAERAEQQIQQSSLKRRVRREQLGLTKGEKNVELATAKSSSKNSEASTSVGDITKSKHKLLHAQQAAGRAAAADEQKTRHVDLLEAAADKQSQKLQEAVERQSKVAQEKQDAVAQFESKREQVVQIQRQIADAAAAVEQGKTKVELAKKMSNKATAAAARSQKEAKATEKRASKAVETEASSHEQSQAADKARKRLEDASVAALSKQELLKDQAESALTQLVRLSSETERTQKQKLLESAKSEADAHVKKAVADRTSAYDEVRKAATTSSTTFKASEDSQDKEDTQLEAALKKAQLDRQSGSAAATASAAKALADAETAQQEATTLANTEADKKLSDAKDSKFHRVRHEREEAHSLVKKAEEDADSMKERTESFVKEMTDVADPKDEAAQQLTLEAAAAHSEAAKITAASNQTALEAAAAVEDAAILAVAQLNRSSVNESARVIAKATRAVADEHSKVEAELEKLATVETDADGATQLVTARAEAVQEFARGNTKMDLSAAKAASQAIKTRWDTQNDHLVKAALRDAARMKQLVERQARANKEDAVAQTDEMIERTKERCAKKEGKPDPVVLLDEAAPVEEPQFSVEAVHKAEAALKDLNKQLKLARKESRSQVIKARRAAVKADEAATTWRRATRKVKKWQRRLTDYTAQAAEDATKAQHAEQALGVAKAELVTAEKTYSTAQTELEATKKSLSVAQDKMEQKLREAVRQGVLKHKEIKWHHTAAKDLEKAQVALAQAAGELKEEQNKLKHMQYTFDAQEQIHNRVVEQAKAAEKHKDEMQTSLEQRQDGLAGTRTQLVAADAKVVSLALKIRKDRQSVAAAAHHKKEQLIVQLDQSTKLDLAKRDQRYATQKVGTAEHYVSEQQRVVDASGSFEKKAQAAAHAAQKESAATIQVLEQQKQAVKAAEQTVQNSKIEIVALRKQMRQAMKDRDTGASKAAVEAGKLYKDRGALEQAEPLLQKEQEKVKYQSDILDAKKSGAGTTQAKVDQAAQSVSVAQKELENAEKQVRVTGEAQQAAAEEITNSKERKKQLQKRLEQSFEDARTARTAAAEKHNLFLAAQVDAQKEQTKVAQAKSAAAVEQAGKQGKVSSAELQEELAATQLKQSKSKASAVASVVRISEGELKETEEQLSGLNAKKQEEEQEISQLHNQTQQKQTVLAAHRKEHLAAKSEAQSIEAKGKLIEGLLSNEQQIADDKKAAVKQYQAAWADQKAALDAEVTRTQKSLQEAQDKLAQAQEQNKDSTAATAAAKTTEQNAVEAQSRAERKMQQASQELQHAATNEGDQERALVSLQQNLIEAKSEVSEAVTTHQAAKDQMDHDAKGVTAAKALVADATQHHDESKMQMENAQEEAADANSNFKAASAEESSAIKASEEAEDTRTFKAEQLAMAQQTKVEEDETAAVAVQHKVAAEAAVPVNEGVHEDASSAEQTAQQTLEEAKAKYKEARKKQFDAKEVLVRKHGIQVDLPAPTI